MMGTYADSTCKSGFKAIGWIDNAKCENINPKTDNLRICWGRGGKPSFSIIRCNGSTNFNSSI